jgi:hypothetical protein
MLARFSADGGASWGDPVVIRDDFSSANGFADLGYPRLYQRRDGQLVAAYFWCTRERPDTHIEATIPEPGERLPDSHAGYSLPFLRLPHRLKPG